MPIDAYVTATDELESKKLVLADRKLISVLGDGAEALAIRIEDVFSSISASIGKELPAESELTIELTGSTSMKAQGGVNYLFFNIGGSTAKDNTMKVCLKTKIGKKK